ncbi:hypothetical protein WJX72_000525 [[Myrmecia] bisecta]|uniref:Uncharacterized protein n=1 Tax=[Myrmecia] bisecta TaxID=41462 RepID=A0AAW1Q038_9CHLO
MKFCLEGWEDGQPVQSWLTSPDRWQTQAAERVTVEVQPGLSVLIQQQPSKLTANRLGVGACLWDGALVLTAYLSAQPRDSFQGLRCLELGAGVGLVGLVLAKLGASVMLTDKPALTSLLRGNVAKNWLGARPHPSVPADRPRGRADVAALEWGKPGYMDQVAAFAKEPLDLVVATDCCYIDPEGETPDSNHFVKACAGLCSAKTRCLVTFETRSDELRQGFLTAAQTKFSHVEQIPHSQVPEEYQVEYIELYELRL